MSKTVIVLQLRAYNNQDTNSLIRTITIMRYKFNNKLTEPLRQHSCRSLYNSRLIFEISNFKADTERLTCIYMRKSFNRKKDDGLRKSKRREEIESEKGSSQGFRKGRITSLLGRISHVRILDHAIDNKFYTRRSSQLSC